ncbi:GerAB/ArcD/ProY family transporter [Virgibacillus sp. W0430]|uniref:GerAB/ArcD/ProY family transporter n=1 Tax=Virgibacillus sp. W0430 TaxID=3391580 RepID=UPI003F447B97
MDQTQGKIGLKEYIGIALIIIGTKLTDNTPTLFFYTLQNSAWLSPFINGVISIFPLYILIKVINAYEHKNLLKVINHLFGNQIGTIFIFVLWLTLAALIIVETATYVDLINTMYFPKTPPIVIYIVLILVCVYAANKGIEQLGAVAWIFVPFIKLSFITVFFLAVGNGQLEFLYPIFGPGAWEIVKESTIKLSIYIELLYLCFLIPYMKSIKQFKKGTTFALAFLIFQLTIGFSAYLVLFDAKAVQMLDFPFHEVLRFINIGFLTNIEMFFFPFWLLATFVRFTFYLYMTAFLFGHLFKIKHFEFTLFPIGLLIIFIGSIPDARAYTLFLFREQFINYLSLLVFLPFLLWMLAKVKGDLNNDFK